MNVMVSVFSGRVEIPDPRADESTFESKRRSGDVFGSVRAAVFIAMSRHGSDRAEQEVEQVEAMRGEIEEKPGAADRRIDAPVGRRRRR